ncbi:hypothetical protein OG875_04800 [Streptomyces sp. NBC_01498]|uniref:hypothetical protein n=1 Tax=Streptomyces sp. NBC_01498 TaxID=2975870 RepID=UPI002E7C391C|nr:hypothetical protein [Streptomyces sp. NBC_01498]WTL23975.1 hypothetical protein OG875_04800 [Streptomyces sp. NBC_01498]
MARIQVLELPEGAGDDRPPFVLVVDETSYPTVEGYQAAVTWWAKLAIGIGAKGCIVTDDTIGIPANDLTLTHMQEAADGNVVRLRVEPDLEGFTETVMNEVAKAQAEVMDTRRRAR